MRGSRLWRLVWRKDLHLLQEILRETGRESLFWGVMGVQDLSTSYLQGLHQETELLSSISSFPDKLPARYRHSDWALASACPRGLMPPNAQGCGESRPRPRACCLPWNARQTAHVALSVPTECPWLASTVDQGLGFSCWAGSSWA